MRKVVVMKWVDKGVDGMQLEDDREGKFDEWITMLHEEEGVRDQSLYGVIEFSDGRSMAIHCSQFRFVIGEGDLAKFEKMGKVKWSKVIGVTGCGVRCFAEGSFIMEDTWIGPSARILISKKTGNLHILKTWYGHQLDTRGREHSTIMMIPSPEVGDLLAVYKAQEEGV